MTTRLRDALPGVGDVTLMTDAPPCEHFAGRGSTRSGRAKLIELDDADAHAIEPGQWLVARFGYGLGPVEVVRVKTGIAGEPGHAYEVPVIEARIPTGQVLSFAPDELCRVRASKGGRS